MVKILASCSEARELGVVVACLTPNLVHVFSDLCFPVSPQLFHLIKAKMRTDTVFNEEKVKHKKKKYKIRCWLKFKQRIYSLIAWDCLTRLTNDHLQLSCVILMFQIFSIIDSRIKSHCVFIRMAKSQLIPCHVTVTWAFTGGRRLWNINELWHICAWVCHYNQQTPQTYESTLIVISSLSLCINTLDSYDQPFSDLKHSKVQVLYKISHHLTVHSLHCSKVKTILLGR